VPRRPGHSAASERRAVPQANSIRGFTLVELCCVLVIAGILAALAGPRFLDSPAFGQRGYTDELAGALRTAGNVADASGCDVEVTIAPGTGYRAEQPGPGAGNTCSGPFTVAVLSEDGAPLAGTPPYNADVAAAETLVFAPNGTVTGPTTVTVVGTPSGATQSLVLQIDPLSGFVTVP
jgi:prepilin-type N-terminal cleavage/methylation domain-containing protein